MTTTIISVRAPLKGRIVPLANVPDPMVRTWRLPQRPDSGNEAPRCPQPLGCIC